MEEAMVQPQIEALLDHGEERGCIDLAEVNELVQALDLNEDQADAVLRAGGGARRRVDDDCGREARRRRPT